MQASGPRSVGRVRDWRLGQLRQAPNAQLYLDSCLTAEDILSYGIPHVAIASGARWRNDGMGRAHRDPLNYLTEGATIGVNAFLENGVDALTNDGPVVVFDDDRYYMASVLAELIASSGRKVAFVTLLQLWLHGQNTHSNRAACSVV